MQEDGVCQHFLVVGPGHGLQWPLGLSFSFVPSHQGRKTAGTACIVSHPYFRGPRRKAVTTEHGVEPRTVLLGAQGQPFVFPAVGARGLHLFAPSVSSQPLAMPRRLGWSKKSKTPAHSIQEQAQNHLERALWLALGPSKVREFGRGENTEVAGRRPGFLVFLPTCRGVVNLWEWTFLGIFPSRLHL